MRMAYMTDEEMIDGGYCTWCMGNGCEMCNGTGDHIEHDE